MGYDAHCPGHRQEVKSANASADDGRQCSRAFEQEQLEPRISDFLIQQDAKRLWDSDQIAEGTVFVGEDELFVRHGNLD